MREVEASGMDRDMEVLAAAYLNEAVSAARCEVLALKAKAEGQPQTERLFKALANAQQAHATKALWVLRGKAGNTADNLERTGEALGESVSEYRDMVGQCADGATIKSILEQFHKTAMNHQGLVRLVDEAKPGPYHICQVCGFVMKDKVPERCPVCDAVPRKFQTVQ